MKETMKGYLGRTKFWTGFYIEKSKPVVDMHYRNENSEPWLYLSRHHGLKPGQIKRATLTIQVDND